MAGLMFNLTSMKARERERERERETAQKQKLMKKQGAFSLAAPFWDQCRNLEGIDLLTDCT
jgi:hypothetical protein